MYTNIKLNQLFFKLTIANIQLTDKVRLVNVFVLGRRCLLLLSTCVCIFVDLVMVLSC